MSEGLRQCIEQSWYGDARWTELLRPFAWLYKAISVRKRRKLSQLNTTFPLPIIVVGNISVGGVGKTPVVMALVRYLQDRGFKPAVVSRGYGGQQDSFPFAVEADTDPALAGDEPVMIASTCSCPVVVDPKRINAAVHAIQHYDCDVIISDDGLQHYAMPRAFELAVIDGARGLGNGLLLPAGPLREQPQRLQEVDAVLINGTTDIESLKGYPAINLRPTIFVNVCTGQTAVIEEWLPQADDFALAAIGNPGRFEATLKQLGYDITVKAFADHHHFELDDLPADAGRILMTEKDAVKCERFRDSRLWYLKVEADIPEQVLEQVEEAIINFGTP